MIGGDDFVHWSVAECNRRYGGQFKAIGKACPRCGQDNWRCTWGVNPQYRSEYNPGEFIQYVCQCGFVGEELPS